MTVNILTGQAAKEATDGVRLPGAGTRGLEAQTAEALPLAERSLAGLQGSPRRIMPPGELLRGREGSSRVGGESWVGGCGASMQGFDW